MYSDILQLAAIQAHMAIASLPCYLGDIAPGIQRIPDAGAVAAEWIWLLVHKDMAKNARVRALIEFLARAFSAHKDIIEGKTCSGDL